MLLERTPRLISMALAKLPSAPDPWIIIRGGSVGSNAGHAGQGGMGVGGEGAHPVGGGAGGCAGEYGDHAVGGGRLGQPVGGQGGGSKALAKDAAGGQGGGGESSVKDAPGGQRCGGSGQEGDLAGARRGQEGDLAGARRGPSLAARDHDINFNYRDLLHLQHESPRSWSWRQAWESNPLVLHDHHLVLEKEELSRAKQGGAADTAAVVPAAAEGYLDVSDDIITLMKKHPGPVRSFRVDSSQWKNDKSLFTWLQILSDKSAEDDPKSVLDLFCCTFQGLKLSWIIADCVCLKELHIGYCTENLEIDSKSLEQVEVWGNFSSWLVIESAPKLTVLVTSIMPREENAQVKVNPRPCHQDVSISINGTPSLRTVKYLLLPYHSITVNSIPIIKGCVSWKSVENMKLGLNMSDRDQRDGLRKILDSLPMLIELDILRMDKVDPNEGFEMVIDCPFEDINNVRCVATCLRKFSIENFRGGAAELHLIKSILRHAAYLLELCTVCHRSCKQKHIGKATAEIDNYEKLSDECQVTHCSAESP